MSLKAKLLEGDFGAKCAAGKYAAAILNEMGKQVLFILKIKLNLPDRVMSKSKLENSCFNLCCPG